MFFSEMKVGRNVEVVWNLAVSNTKVVPMSQQWFSAWRQTCAKCEPPQSDYVKKWRHFQQIRVSEFYIHMYIAKNFQIQYLQYLISQGYRFDSQQVAQVLVSTGPATSTALLSTSRRRRRCWLYRSFQIPLKPPKPLTSASSSVRFCQVIVEFSSELYSCNKCKSLYKVNCEELETAFKDCLSCTLSNIDEVRS